MLRPSAQLHSALLNGEVPPSSSGANRITVVPGFRWSPRAKARGRSSCRWSTGDRERGGPGRPPPTPICKGWPPPAKGSAHRDSHELLDLALRSVSEDIGAVPQGSPANKPHECLWHPIGFPRRFPPEATLVSSEDLEGSAQRVDGGGIKRGSRGEQTAVSGREEDWSRLKKGQSLFIHRRWRRRCQGCRAHQGHPH